MNGGSWAELACRFVCLTQTVFCVAFISFEPTFKCGDDSYKIRVWASVKEVGDLAALGFYFLHGNTWIELRKEKAFSLKKGHRVFNWPEFSSVPIASLLQGPVSFALYFAHVLLFSLEWKNHSLLTHFSHLNHLPCALSF